MPAGAQPAAARAVAAIGLRDQVKALLEYADRAMDPWARAPPARASCSSSRRLAQT